MRPVRANVADKPLRMQERDIELLRQMYRARFLTMSHVSRYFFGGKQFAYNRLAHLASAGYIRRMQHTAPCSNGRAKAIALYLLTPSGMKAIDVPVHRTYFPDDIDFHIAINEIALSLSLHGIVWTYGHELKRSQGYLPGVPLLGIANDTFVFRCQKAFQIKMAYDFFLGYHGYQDKNKAVIIVNNDSLNELLISSYPGGSVRVITVDDMPWLLPRIITSPKHYISELLARLGLAVPEADVRNSYVSLGRAVCAELITGDMEALTALRDWPNSSWHVLVRDGYSLPEGCNAYYVNDCS